MFFSITIAKMETYTKQKYPVQFFWKFMLHRIAAKTQNSHFCFNAIQK
jgi:hypothetical protein